MTEELKIRYHEDWDIYYAVDGDPYVWTEQRRDYLKVTERANGADVLEFGSHCGFHNLWLTRNANPRSITSVEADPRLEPLIRKNMRPDTNLIMAAVVDDPEKDTVPLHLGKSFTATNSLEHFRGRRVIDVPTVQWRDLLEKEPDYIKCDCEGGEYLLNWADLPYSVATIAIEFHFHRDWWIEEMDTIDYELLQQGFRHIKKPKVNTFQKVNIGLYARD